MSTLRVPLSRRWLLRRAVFAGAVALLVVALVPPVASASGTCTLGTVPDGSGTAGTSANPYAVASAADLAKVGVGDCPLSAHYRQTADMTLPAPTPGSSNHVPIGKGTPVYTGSPFTGGYDGSGYTISGLTIDTPSVPYVGLFSVVNGARLERIRLIDVSVAGDQVAGGLVGYAIASTISDVQVTGAVSAQSKVGGLVGWGAGTSFAARTSVSDSSAAVSVRVVSNATFTSAGQGGGLVGALELGGIDRSSATGDVTAVAVGRAFELGGLVGDSFQGSVTDSLATGDVTATGSSAEVIGGLVGHGEEIALINALATGAVSGTDKVGGLAGQLVAGEMFQALAVGRVSATAGAPNVGGLLGVYGLDNEIGGSFWDVTTTDQASDPAGAPGVVEGLTTADLRRFVTFDTADWRIVDEWVPYDALAAPVWGICDGRGYPFLLWTFASDPCVVANGSIASGGDDLATTVAFAAETAAAARVAGTSSGVRVRGGESLPVTSGVSGAVGPRGGVVLVSEGMEVRVASPLGAREDAGVVVPSSGAFETSVTGALVPDSVIEVWINSEPRLVAAARVPTGGGPVTIGIPTGAPLDGGDPIADGAHTLQLRMSTVDGYEVIATGITIGRVMPTGVPAGEGPAPSQAPSLLFGAGLLLLLVVRASGRDRCAAGSSPRRVRSA